MPAITVRVKWGGKVYDVDVDTDNPELVPELKKKLRDMTGVAPERQKITLKGRMLKDDMNPDLKEGTTLFMMGTVGELPKAPEQKTQFIETMSDRQLAETLKLPAGLTNLGNTCYMNSTLQCLRVIPELRETLNRYPGNLTDTDAQQNLTASLRDLYRQLNRTTEGYPPLVFLQMLRTVYPQFAQRDNHGYMQQDAKECWTEIVSCLNSKLKLDPNMEGSSDSTSTGAASENESFNQRFMTGEFTTTIKCDEESNEEPSITTDTFTELDCHISISTNYMQNGIMESLDTKIEKNSPTLDRQAVYSKKQRISKLPAYLTVQFVRFFWKQREQVKAKSLRKVKFPFTLDTSEFCTEELQHKLAPVKSKLLELEKERESVKKKANLSQEKTEPEALASDEARIEEIKGLVDPELAKRNANVTGLYELCAVLTHKGRTADSGHYIAWVEKDDSDEWIKYDDDKVTLVTKEDVERLDGGGDWHIAYILLYRSKKIA